MDAWEKSWSEKLLKIFFQAGVFQDVDGGFKQECRTFDV